MKIQKTLVGGCLLSVAAVHAGAQAPPEVPPPATVAATTPPQPASVGEQSPRKLPKIKKYGSDPYPPQAMRTQQTGRVIVEFRIDREGNTVAARILTADAGSALQASALQIVKTTQFDVSDPAIDFADPTPFQMAFRWVLTK